MIHISLTSVSVQYDEFVVLKEINFKAQEGEFIVIVGKSGSGKTTFLHALARLVPSRGEVLMPKNIGMVFQQNAVFPWLTASENIAFGLTQKTKYERERIVLEHLKIAGLEDKKDKYSAELSGGQVQRIALARSLAHDPDVLLMDEPYGALDEHTRGIMQEWLLDVWTTHKKTVVFVTHNIEEAIFLADRVLVLSHGTFTREFRIPFARPRHRDITYTPEFTRLRKQISKSVR
ncbi:MAG: ABC transporter ATP-binding protein [Patescibacteria group bacterium]